VEALSPRGGWEMEHEHCKEAGSFHMERLLWRLVRQEDDHREKVL